MPPYGDPVRILERRCLVLGKLPNAEENNDDMLSCFDTIIIIIIINVKIIVTLSQNKMLQGTVQNVMSKFAVNAVQQINSTIMSGHQGCLE